VSQNDRTENHRNSRPLLLGVRLSVPSAHASIIDMHPVKGNVQQVVTVSILTITLSLIWGGMLMLAITLLARGWRLRRLTRSFDSNGPSHWGPA
jgi:hypothetical protein